MLYFGLLVTKRLEKKAASTYNIYNGGGMFAPELCYVPADRTSQPRSQREFHGRNTSDFTNLVTYSSSL